MDKDSWNICKQKIEEVCKLDNEAFSKIVKDMPKTKEEIRDFIYEQLKSRGRNVKPSYRRVNFKRETLGGHPPEQDGSLDQIIEKKGFFKYNNLVSVQGSLIPVVGYEHTDIDLPSIIHQAKQKYPNIVAVEYRNLPDWFSE